MFLLQFNDSFNLIYDGIQKVFTIYHDDVVYSFKKNFNTNNSIVHFSTFSANHCINDPVIGNYFNLLKDYAITKHFYENKNLILVKRQLPNLKGSERGRGFRCNNLRDKLCLFFVAGSSILFRPT